MLPWARFYELQKTDSLHQAIHLSEKQMHDQRSTVMDIVIRKGLLSILKLVIYGKLNLARVVEMNSTKSRQVTIMVGQP
ncbi:hypothetical protein D3C81_1333750 [compost metagenome]